MEFYPHQVQALTKTENLNRVAYYMDMGLGKTFVGAEKMRLLNKTVNLIVCQKSKMQDWLDHMKTYIAYVPEFVYDLTDKKQFAAFLEHVAASNDPATENCYGVVNYDLVWRRKILAQLQHFTLMLDESSMIQNETAKRSKFILKMNPDNVILLSGTPTSGKYENLWSQIHLLGWEITSKLYNRQYVNWEKIEAGDFPIWVVSKEEPYKNVDRLKNKLREHGAFFLKTDECFDLPDQTFIQIKVPINKLYKVFRKKNLVTVDTLNLCEFEDESDFWGKDMTPRVELVGDTTFTQRLYSRMLCGHYNKDKLQAFKDLAESTKDRLIVFYNFNDELSALLKIAKALERPISQINGATKDLTAYERCDDSITLVQYQAGAMGLNLQKANKVVFFTLTDRSELFEQAKKRIHRIGQDKPCFYYLLLCQNSIEEVMLETLEQRKDFTDELFRECEV